MLTFGFAVLVLGGIWYWYYHRSQPPDEARTLFQGIEYRRISRQKPRPIVLHIVTVDLSAPGIEFFVTPPDQRGDRPLKARTTSQFLNQFGVQLAVNGDGFKPWWSRTLWDYYPHVGDSVAVLGLAASRGSVYSSVTPSDATLFISKPNRVTIGKSHGPIYNAVSGLNLMLKAGKSIITPRFEETEPHPRTAVGLEKSDKRLILLLVDGRQPNYSEGVLLPELAELMREFGIWNGINLDGGGSTTLVINGSDGRPEVLNCPIDNRIPGRERPVANHLGIFARPAR